MSLSRCASRWTRYGVVLLVLCALGPRAAADEPTSVTRDAAKNILEVLKAGDRGVLAFHLRYHDAWKIAFHLCSMGNAKVAEDLAVVSDPPDLEALRAKIRLWKSAPPDAEIVSRWTAMDGAYEQERWKDVLAHYGAFSDKAPAFLRLDAALVCARARYETGDYEGAAGLLEPAVESAKAMGWVWGVARAYWRLGHAQRQLGEYESALESWARCAVAHERRGAVLSAAAARTNIAALHVEFDDAWPAVSMWEDAIRVYKARNGDGKYDPYIITELQNLGWARTRIGPHAAALAAFQESRDLAVALGDKAEIVDCDIGLATVLRSVGDWDRAEATALAAVAAAKALKDDINVARALGTLGLVRYDAKRYEEARVPYEQALEMLVRIRADEAFPPDQREAVGRWVDIATSNLAHALVHLNEEALARKHFKAVLASDFVTSAMEVNAREGLAAVHRKAGRLPKAIAELKRGRKIAKDAELVNPLIDIYAAMAEMQLERGKHSAALAAARSGIEVLTKATRGLEHGQQARARGRRKTLFTVGMRASAELGDVKAFNDVLENSRAIALLELLEDPERLRKALIPEALLEERQAAITEEALARTRLQDAHRGGNLRAARKHRDEMRAAQTKARAIVERIQAVAKSGADLLYPHAASLELIRRSLKPDDLLIQFALLPGKSFAAVTNRKTTRIVPLGETDEIEALLEAAIGRSSDPEKKIGATRDELGQRVILPLGAQGVKRILISADGALHFVPLSQMMRGGEVLYVPSGTAIQRMPKRSAAPTRDVLAFGDPTYASKRRLPSLPESGAEAKTVGTEVRIGAQATETELKQQLSAGKHWRAVHIACHGRFDPKRPMQSALELGADDENDGRLTCEEIFQLKINADLVVLSACESGRGDVASAEGLIGLTRAFLVAGASRVLCSLWRVDDAATRALMEKFYELWKSGVHMNRALDEARAYVRGHPKWEHPYYWAPWVFWGMSL